MKRYLSTALAVWLASTAALAAEDAIPTGQLPRTVMPERVMLDLTLDPDASGFEGRAVIDVAVIEATDTIWMHGRDLRIASAVFRTMAGEQIPLTAEQVHPSGVLKLTAQLPLAAGSGRIEIAWSADYSQQLEGAYQVRAGEDRYLITQMEPLGARSAFPGFDEPSFKHPWDLSLVVPDGHRAFANTAQVGIDKVRDGWRRLRFAPTEALPSYLIAFAVGPWDVVEWEAIPANAVRDRPLPLRGIAVRGRGKEFDYALRHTAEVVEALERYFDSPYPFDKLDLVAAPDFAFGAMENAGLIVYRDSLLLSIDKAAARTQAAYWEVHAHELAHQWFGNLVTMPWWDDIWLNESFATWLAQKIAHGLRPAFNLDRDIVQGGLRAMSGDSLASTRRIREPVRQHHDVLAAFDGITYAKGGAVLAMFEAQLGETAFRDAVRGHMRRFARGNATSDDLIASLTRGHSDASRLQAAFTSFVDQPGVPFLDVDLRCDDGPPRVDLRQRRYLLLGSELDATQTWVVPVCLRYGVEGKAGSSRQCALIEGAQASIALATETCPAWLLPNADAAGYYRFVLEEADQRALAAVFPGLSPLEQRVYADSLLASFGNGTLKVEALLDALPMLAASPVREVQTAPLPTLAWIAEHLLDEPKAKRAFVERIAAVYRPKLDEIGIDPRPGDTPETRGLRGDLIGLFVDTLEDTELRRALAERGRRVVDADGKGKLVADAIDPDLRGTALAMLALTGDAADFDLIERHALASGDTQLRAQLFSALGRFTDPALADRARSLGLDPHLRSGESALALRTQLGEAATRGAARDWLRSRYDEIETRLPRPFHARMPALDASGMCDDDDAIELACRYTDRMARTDGGSRALAQTLERVRLCAAQRTHHREAQR